MCMSCRDKSADSKVLMALCEGVERAVTPLRQLRVKQRQITKLLPAPVSASLRTLINAMCSTVKEPVTSGSRIRQNSAGFGVGLLKKDMREDFLALLSLVTKTMETLRDEYSVRKTVCAYFCSDLCNRTFVTETI